MLVGTLYIIGQHMRENVSRSREELFTPHGTTITLPDGSELTVDRLPYEGWGTEPGCYICFVDYDETENGSFIFSDYIEWIIPALR